MFYYFLINIRITNYSIFQNLKKILHLSIDLYTPFTKLDNVLWAGGLGV